MDKQYQREDLGYKGDKRIFGIRHLLINGRYISMFYNLQNSITLKMIKIGKRKHSNVVSTGQKEQLRMYMKCVISNPVKIAHFQSQCIDKIKVPLINYVLNRQNWDENELLMDNLWKFRTSEVIESEGWIQSKQDERIETMSAQKRGMKLKKIQ